MPSVDELVRLDCAHYLHPFTDHVAMRSAGTNIIVEGKGCWVTDARGRRLLDGLAGLWCVNVGYGRREIIEAICTQLEQLPFYPSFFNSATPSAIILAARLSKMAPGRLRHAFFSNSGSEANESALKMIRGYHKVRGETQRTKILSRTFSYHGVTLATTSMTGLPACYSPFDLPLPGFIHVPGPYAYGAGHESDPVEYGRWCVEETERIITTEGPSTIAAFFVEPVQGAGGVVPPPEGYLAAIRDLCRRHGILFVADEVITGFGRLGKMFGSELWNLDPDLMSLAKGITSGYVPLGASLVSDEIAETLVKGGYFAHGFTYSGHPVACSAALANLDVIEKENLVERVDAVAGPHFQECLAALREHPLVGEVRGLGLIGAIELLNADGSKPPLTSTLGVTAAAIAREEGVIVRGIRNLLALSPPFTIDREETDVLFDAVGRTLDRLLKVA